MSFITVAECKIDFSNHHFPPGLHLVIWVNLDLNSLCPTKFRPNVVKRPTRDAIRYAETFKIIIYAVLEWSSQNTTHPRPWDTEN